MDDDKILIFRNALAVNAPQSFRQMVINQDFLNVNLENNMILICKDRINVAEHLTQRKGLFTCVTNVTTRLNSRAFLEDTNNPNII